MHNPRIPMTTGPYKNKDVEDIPSWYLEWLMATYPDQLLDGAYDAIELEYDWRSCNKGHWDDGKTHV